MNLTIAEDLTSLSTATLDSELISIPDTGLYLNSGVHQSITVNNLLDYLPRLEFTFATYVAGTTYGKYTDTRKTSDIVLDGGITYQSLTAANIGNTPASNPTNWLVTNIESLRIKTLALKSEDAAIRKINLSKRVIENQYMYNLVETTETPNITALPNDYAATVFEPRGSDYMSFTINQISLQAPTATPQNLYVVNQGVLITTLTLNPNAAGRLEFEDLNYTFSGKGKWYFIIDSQDVLTNGSFVDPLRYDSFVTYNAVGIGTTPEGSTYSDSVSNNGLNFNVSTFLDTTTYINNNMSGFGSYLQAAWEMDVLNMFINNSNTRSNVTERDSFNRAELIVQTGNIENGTVARNFREEKKKAIKQLERTFDRQLDNNNNDLTVEYGSI